jgi:hypothetical protein
VFQHQSKVTTGRKASKIHTVLFVVDLFRKKAYETPIQKTPPAGMHYYKGLKNGIIVHILPFLPQNYLSL